MQFIQDYLFVILGQIFAQCSILCALRHLIYLHNTSLYCLHLEFSPSGPLSVECDLIGQLSFELKPISFLSL
jgi:hypothetical protein